MEVLERVCANAAPLRPSARQGRTMQPIDSRARRQRDRRGADLPTAWASLLAEAEAGSVRCWAAALMCAVDAARRGRGPGVWEALREDGATVDACLSQLSPSDTGAAGAGGDGGGGEGAEDAPPDPLLPTLRAMDAAIPGIGRLLSAFADAWHRATLHLLRHRLLSPALLRSALGLALAVQDLHSAAPSPASGGTGATGRGRGNAGLTAVVLRAGVAAVEAAGGAGGDERASALASRLQAVGACAVLWLAGVVRFGPHADAAAAHEVAARWSESAAVRRATGDLVAAVRSDGRRGTAPPPSAEAAEAALVTSAALAAASPGCRALLALPQLAGVRALLGLGACVASPAEPSTAGRALSTFLQWCGGAFPWLVPGAAAAPLLVPRCAAEGALSTAERALARRGVIRDPNAEPASGDGPQSASRRPRLRESPCRASPDAAEPGGEAAADAADAGSDWCEGLGVSLTQEEAAARGPLALLARMHDIHRARISM